MRYGRYDLDIIETGLFRLDGGAMFGVVPKNLWQRSNPADEQNRIDMTMRSLLLRDGERTVLIDCGLGHKESEKFHRIYGVETDSHDMLPSLASLGVTAEQVTDLILTHLHFDHAGGAVQRKDGDLALTFPNATHYVQKSHWEWACAPTDRDRASFFRDNIHPLHESGRLMLLDGPEQLLDGMSLHIVNGHTFGQQLVEVAGRRSSMLFAGDLIPMAAHVPAPYIMGYDLQPLVTLEEKQRMLPEAIERNTVLYFEHDPFIQAGIPEAGEKGYALRRHGSLFDMLTAAEGGE